MTFELSKRSLDRMKGIDTRLVEIAKEAIKVTKIDFGIPADGGKRTAERQFELFQQGLSKADGYDKWSRHQSGRALDFFAYVHGRASWEPEHLSMIACAMLQSAIKLGYRVRWGGLFKSFNDMPHIELLED